MRTRYAIPALAAALLAPMAAYAERAYTTDRVSLRAGPGRDYPRIERLPSDTRVNVHGCLGRFDWCDVTYRGARGWIDGEDLAMRRDGRRVRMYDYGPRSEVPIITFSFDNYWNDYYPRRSFYRERDYWRGRARDQDRDGVPNRYDRDQDGDGIGNRYDRDVDGDGRRNSRDRDRDGDGIRNRYDDQPNRPR